MDISASTSSAAYALYTRNDAIDSAPQIASATGSSQKNADGKSPGDVVRISEEARHAAATSIETTYSFTTVRTFDMPNGMQATLDTAVTESGATAAQLSYVDANGTQHTLFLDKSSTLRMNANGVIEVIPYDNSADTTEEAVFGGTSRIVNLQDAVDNIEKTIKNVQGTDADEIFILLPSNTRNTMWNVDAGNGNNVIVDVSGEEATIRTGDGNDTILGIGGLGYQVDSGDGDDSIDLDGGVSSTVNAGSGNDTITLKGGAGSVYGGAGSDSITINGSISGAHIYGDGPDGQDAGDDTIAVHGSMHMSRLHTGNGNNSVYVQNASTSDIVGGSGKDSISVGNIHKTGIDGGDGDDIVKADHITDSVLIGGNGNNTIYVGTATSTWGSNAIYGGKRQRAAEDEEAGHSGLLYRAIRLGVDSGPPENSGDGNNTITVGEARNTKIYGGSGDDSITVNKATEAFIGGGDGADAITVKTLSNSEILGGIGNNTINVSTSTDSHIYGNTPAPSLKNNDQENDDDEKGELSELEQEIADAAMGIKKDTASVEDSAIISPEEELVSPIQQEHTSERDSDAAYRYSGRYNSGASGRGGAKFSVTI